MGSTLGRSGPSEGRQDLTRKLVLWAKLAFVGSLRRAWRLLPRSWALRALSAASWLGQYLPPAVVARARRLGFHLSRTPIRIEGEFPAWIDLYERTGPSARQAAAATIVGFVDPPLISIVMPVFNPSPKHLRAAIRSVLDQFYPFWELCIADDASTDPAVAKVLREMLPADPRTKVTCRQTNGNISAASNSALSLASGSFVALLDHDDLLPPDALYEVAATIMANPEVDLIYSDEDQIDDTGQRFAPYFKPDWNPELMLGQNLVSHLGVYRRTLIERIGGFRTGLEGSQDYDLALRTVTATSSERIIHIQKILYHWRKAGRNASFSDRDIERCARSGRRAVNDFLSVTAPGAVAEVNPWLRGWHRVVYPIPTPEPLVSVIIPTRDHADMLLRTTKGLLARTDYQALEVLIIDNGSDEPEALDLLERLQLDRRVRVLNCPGPFNYSALNNHAVRLAAGELLLLLNNDVDVIGPGWVREMVSHAIRPGIGAVGARLLYPDGTVQHGGITLSLGGVAWHQYLKWPGEDHGYSGQLRLARNVMAVTGACLMVRRSAFLEVGGLDEVYLPVAFSDVDLCLKLVERGYRNVWTPHAELYHLESASRGSDLVGEKAARFQLETAHMRARWGHVLDHDPYWNPNLALDISEIRLAFPPRHNHQELSEPAAA
jgi:glycosyltransferase involved in cell wall biosynthesis